MIRKTPFCLSEASCSNAMRAPFFSAGALGGRILTSVNCKKCKMVYGRGVTVMGEGGVGASYRKRILQSLQLSDCQT